MRLLIAGLLATCSFAASAQSLKPGLWEITTRMDGAAGGAMAMAQEQMKNMPPEQRKMVEEMMAKNGVRMGASNAGGMSVQVCISKAMAERSEVPVGKGDCKVTSQQRTGNTMKAAFACTNPPSTGEAQVTFNGGDAYTSKVVLNTTAGGKPETMNIDSSGKFVAADCGNLKPPASR